MPEENGVPQGEGTPATPPVETPEPGQTPAPGENPSQTPGTNPEGSIPKTIPYERFKEINDKYQELKGNYEQVAPILESLKQPPKPEEEVDPNQFQSAGEFIQYMDKKNAGERKAMEHKFEARIEAERKLSEVRESYPEIKTDRTFRDFVIMKMQQSPSIDVMDAAKSVKEYFSTIESRGREATKKEFLEKGTFQGKVEGNQPRRSSEDEEVVKNIVGAGKGSGSVFG